MVKPEMYTLEEFAEKNNKTVETVKKWAKQRYIPIFIDGKNDIYVIDEARIPYTANRAKVNKSTGDKIVKSILKACNERYYINADLYGQSEADFQTTMNGLIAEHLVDSFILDGKVSNGKFIYYNISS